MEAQTNFGELKIGTKEPEKTKLEPKMLKIVSYVVEEIEKAHAKKVIFEAKHPDKPDPIRISAVSCLVEKQVTTSGTWLNLDDDGNIFKNSALARLMLFLKVENLDSTVGKDIDSELDERGYLAFKAY